MTSQSLYFIAYTLELKWSKMIRTWQKEMCQKFKICKSLSAPPHITLVPPFRSDPDKVSELLKVIETENNHISIITDDMNHFDDRVIYVDVNPSDELTRIRNHLIKEVRNLDIDVRARKDFNAHITIGHKIAKQNFPKAWAHFKNYKMQETIILEGPYLFVHSNGNWQRANY